MIKKLHNKKEQGFSLIEMVVVLAIFFIIISIALSIFLSVVQEQKSALAEQELLNQTSYVVDTLSRGLKMATPAVDTSCLGTVGQIYQLTHCPADTSLPCNGISFINQLDNNACEEFFLDTTTNPSNPTLDEIKNGGTEQNILSNTFTIKYARFIIDGNQATQEASTGDLAQPRVTILLDVQTQNLANQKEEIIQTTISQISVNIPQTQTSGTIKCTQDSDCGSDVLTFDDLQCINHQETQYYVHPYCERPGTVNSSCNAEILGEPNGTACQYAR